jgi:exoribonuclease R
LVIISRPFHLIGKISLSKRGDGFVKLTSGNEVFIPSELTGGAISGDKVEILPLRSGKKDRLEGEVREIVLRGRNLYRMRIDEADGNYFYGKLMDMQGEIKEGALRKKSLLADVIKSIKPGENLTDLPNLYLQNQMGKTNETMTPMGKILGSASFHQSIENLGVALYSSTIRPHFIAKLYYYTFFTSPMRRVVDCFVQNCLIGSESEVKDYIKMFKHHILNRTDINSQCEKYNLFIAQ